MGGFLNTRIDWSTPVRLVTALMACALIGACSSDDGVREDAVSAILSNPDRFEGKVVTVRGFVNLAQNESALYLHVDDYRWAIQANGIWLHMPHCANRAGQAVTQGYMTVIGNFTAKLHGHADSWIGEIDNIKACRLIEGVADDARPRELLP